MLVPGSSCETLEAKFEVAPAVSTILADFSENKLCPHYLPFVFIPTGMNSDVFPLQCNFSFSLGFEKWMKLPLRVADRGCNQKNGYLFKIVTLSVS